MAAGILERVHGGRDEGETGVTESFPLHWPENHQRTAPNRRQRSRFKTGFGVAIRAVVSNLRLLGARNQVVSTNVPQRRDGLPLASAKRVDDPGVAVYFRYKDRPMVFACDRWDRAEDNIWAIAKTIEAMRGIERWGSGDMLDTAFSGFQALPPPGADNRRPWRQVLLVEGLSCSIPAVALAGAEASYRTLARERHPDNGGNHQQMSELNAAIAEARKELGGAP
jgi:hypothetical protein